MSTTLLQKAGLTFLLLLLVATWAIALLLLVNFFLWIERLIEFVLELTQLGY